MAETLRWMIKTFQFSAKDRAALALSDNTLIHLNDVENRVQLRNTGAVAAPVYSLSTGLTVERTATHPAGLRSLDAFQAAIRHKKVGGSIVTSAGFRLTTSGGEYWWDGAAWAAPGDPGTDDWNTEAEVATNIAAFSPVALAAGKTFGVRVRLGTTDADVSPELYWVKVGYNIRPRPTFAAVFQRGLGDKVRAIRPITDFAHTTTAIGTTFNLGSIITGAAIPFTVTDVDSVFNETADPDLDVNILVSYNPTTKVVTLAGSLAVGVKLRIRVVYKPQVAVISTSSEYTEVDKVPSYQIRDIAETMNTRLAQKDWVVNKTTGAAKVLLPPRQLSYSFNIDAFGASEADSMAMAHAILGWSNNDLFVTDPDTDERYRLIIRAGTAFQTRPAANNLHVIRVHGELLNVLLYDASEAGNAVVQLNINDVEITSTTGNPPLGDGTR